MTWFRVDDSFYDHPKVLAIPPRQRANAIALWLMAGSWCARHLTDGHVPRSAHVAAEFMPSRARVAAASALCRCGLWAETSSGYQFANWHEYQPTRQAVESKRESGAARVRKYRERNAVTRAYAAEHVTPPPSRPVPDPDQLPAAADPRLLTGRPTPTPAPVAAAAPARLDPRAAARGVIRGAYARAFEARYGSQPSDTSADTSEAEAALVHRAATTGREIRELGEAAVRAWFDANAAGWRKRPRFSWLLRDLGDVLADARAADEPEESPSISQLFEAIGGAR